MLKDILNVNLTSQLPNAHVELLPPKKTVKYKWSRLLQAKSLSSVSTVKTLKAVLFKALIPTRDVQWPQPLPIHQQTSKETAIQTPFMFWLSDTY